MTTAVEHNAVLEPCRWLAQQGYEVTYVTPGRDGNLTAEQVLAAVRPDTALVSVMMVNNETGCVFPVAEIAKQLRQRNPRTLLHTDAVQGFLKTPFAAETLGADMISVSARSPCWQAADRSGDCVPAQRQRRRSPVLQGRWSCGGSGLRKSWRTWRRSRLTLSRSFPRSRI